jgi:error-prone DNA polymerase
MGAFAELLVASNFSFLRAASHPEELIAAAKALDLSAIGIADRNSLAGAVRMHVAAKEAGVRLVVGARLEFSDGTPDIAVYPEDRAAYGRLCRLLTTGNRRAPKGECLLALEDLAAHCEGLLLLVVPPVRVDDAFLAALTAISALRPGAVWTAATLSHCGQDRRRLQRLERMAKAAGAPLLATQDVLVHTPERRALLDVVTCIRAGVTLDHAGLRLAANAERHLKSGAETLRLFRDRPEAVSASVELMTRAAFSLDELRYEYPEEAIEGYETAQGALEALTVEGARQRYPKGVPAKVEAAIRHEFAIIAELDYARYFLTVHDIVRFARARGILCQGRGSAANSAVCFCLGITEVDPERGDLLFERFISPERREPPDIDVDFEHERREEVIQYIYGKYGRERAGLTATVICYRARMALREVAKVFGLSPDAIDALAGTIWGWSSTRVEGDQIAKLGMDPGAPPLSHVLALSEALSGFPRHLSQHTGGFVITRGRLDEVIPVMNAAMAERTTVEWDKDDLDALGILKIDVLALGMLTCIRKALALLGETYGRPMGIADIPAEDPAVYDMICRADTIGVFQIESRAQMSMLPRLRPRTFYDLVIEVAIVRPGPIQGDMVHPYLRRRQGLEVVSYPSAELESVLGKTLGVPLFQEQAMRIAIVAGGFTPAEADKLRRAMATFRRVGTIGTFQTKLVEGMAAKGYDRAFAERCFKQIEGFGEYGFPESHAASFALLVYASCWLKCHYPDAFAAALLNAQPMGFYSASQIVRDAREHGVEVRAVDISFSDWDCTLERDGHAADRLHRNHAEMKPAIWSSHAIRLGFRQIEGLKERDARRLVAVRGDMAFDSVRDLWLRTGLSPDSLERLADADAFRSLGLDRRDALWAVKGLTGTGEGSHEPLPLFDRVDRPDPTHEPDAHLPGMPLGEHVVNDYRFLSLSLKAHPVSFVRHRLERMKVTRHEDLSEIARGLPQRRTSRPRADGSVSSWQPLAAHAPLVRVAGLVLVRQRPGSAKGVIFATLEDETGVSNIIVWPKIFERYRPVVLGARLLGVRGRLQAESGVIHVVAEHLEDLTPLLADLGQAGPLAESLANADEVRRPQEDVRSKRQPTRAVLATLRAIPELALDVGDPGSVMPKGRNFH